MTEAEARSAILQAYAVKYPDWTDTRVASVVRSDTGMYFAMVLADDEDEDEIEELCIVDRNGVVRIFDGTGDLVYNLANLRTSALTFFSPTIISALAFLITLISVIAFTWYGGANKEGLQALTGILGLAAGFYFGNQAGRA